MAVTNTPVFPQTPNRGLLQLTSSPGTYGTVYTAGSNGSKIIALLETNTDTTVTHLVTIEIYNGTTGFIIGSLTTGLGDGDVNGIPAKNLFSSSIIPGLPVDSDGNPFIFLNSGDTLKATYATALTSGAAINFIAIAADF